MVDRVFRGLVRSSFFVDSATQPPQLSAYHRHSRFFAQSSHLDHLTQVVCQLSGCSHVGTAQPCSLQAPAARQSCTWHAVSL